MNSQLNEHGSHIDELAVYPNIGPVMDMAVIELDREGQTQIVTCSGVGVDGSLRVIRNGVGISELASIDLPDVQGNFMQFSVQIVDREFIGVWTIRTGEDEARHNTMVVSFVSQTAFLEINNDEVMKL